jgi:hypothetical protein
MSVSPVNTNSKDSLGTEVVPENLDQLNKDLAEMKRLGIPDGEARKLLADLKAAGIYVYVGSGAFSSVGATSLQDFMKLLSDPTKHLYIMDGNYNIKGDSQQILDSFKTRVAEALGKLPAAIDRLSQTVDLMAKIVESRKDMLASVEAMKRLLSSGDIEGAVMLLQTTRAKVLEAQLTTRIDGMQARNNAIKAKNDDLAQKQNDLAGLTGDDKKSDYQKKQAEITKAKGDLDALNSESQLDMIGIQGLVNKRNEAFDTLTNLLGKFQKTIDGIVGNLR